MTLLDYESPKQAAPSERIGVLVLLSSVPISFTTVAILFAPESYSEFTWAASYRPVILMSLVVCLALFDFHVFRGRKLLNRLEVTFFAVSASIVAGIPLFLFLTVVWVLFFERGSWI